MQDVHKIVPHSHDCVKKIKDPLAYTNLSANEHGHNRNKIR